MLVRIKFAKYGVMKFIGHLDVMRYFQKAIRRSGISIVYTTGFNPHQIMSFASPLGVGITSDAEYIDIELEPEAPELTQTNSEQVIQDLLEETMTQGFEILAVKLIGEREPQKRQENAMALVSAADYMVSWKDGYELPAQSMEALWQYFFEFFAKSSIMVNKKSKKNQRDIDIKPYIYRVSTDGCEFYFNQNAPAAIVSIGYPRCIGTDRVNVVPSHVKNLIHAEEYKNDFRLFMRLSAGSTMNIKPELVLGAFYSFIKKEFDENTIQLHRMEMYRGETELTPLI